MNPTLFENFDKHCSKYLTDSIDEILRTTKGQTPCSIGFITTDDFYGFYLCWNNTTDIDSYYNWQQALYPEFLYQPVVEIVDSCKTIDFCKKSDEKWAFAQALLTVLEKNIKKLPDEIFHNNHCQREDILFFSTMSDGDYIQELYTTSVPLFNSSKTIETYGLKL